MLPMMRNTIPCELDASERVSSFSSHVELRRMEHRKKTSYLLASPTSWQERERP